MRVLYLIPEGTEQDEKNLHYHFRDFKKPYGREWFTYSPEILEFFQSHTTKDSLGELEQRIDKRKLLIKNPEVEIWVKSIMEVVYVDLNPLNKPEISDDLLEDFLVNYDNLQDYIQSRFPDFHKEIEEVYKELTKPLSPEIQEYLEKFNSIPYFHDKMRYVCELGNSLNPDRFELFLNSIPKEFKNYYTILGPSGCSACSFKNNEMEKEYKRRLSNQEINLKDSIYDNFHEGDRYTKAFIKEKLREIYQEFSYQGTPKASDLKEYFDIKPCMLPNSKTGKRENGFEILNKKRVD